MPLSSHVTGGRRPAARYGKSQPNKAARSIRANRPSPSARYGLQTQRPDPHPTSQGHQSVPQIPTQRHHDHIRRDRNPASWTAALAADSGDDASTQPGRACHRSTQQCRWACAQGSMQWPWSGGELLKVAVDRGCPVGVGVLDRLGGLVGSVGGEQGGFLGRDGSCVAL
jgi:hypothetical protein